MWDKKSVYDSLSFYQNFPQKNIWQQCLADRGIITARCMHKRGILCRHAVSVRLSRSWVASKRIKISSNFFSPSGSHTSLVFSHQTGWRYSDGNPLNEGVECKGVWKNDDFRPISRSISETVIVRWAHAATQFVSIEFSFYPYNT